MKYKLEFIVFISGAAIMILELAGSRVLAPYLGTSIFVWTGLIMVIMGSLSLGYYLGGIIADKQASYRELSVLLFLAGVAVLAMDIIKDPILRAIQASEISLQQSAVWAALFLFGVPSTLLGMVSPYAAKLKLKNLNSSGKTVGNLYAISTVGSIFGTFITGFYLISYLGTTNILYVVSGLLFAISILAFFDINAPMQLMGIVLLLVFSARNYVVQQTLVAGGYIDTDTQYNRVRIFDSTDAFTGEKVRALLLGNQRASEMSLENDQPAFAYEKFFGLFEHFVPESNKVLVMGGAAYSFPKYFLKNYPDKHIDVVEIDPTLTALAKKYFGLQESPNLNIFHEDARMYLNKTSTKYDVIFNDAFNTASSIPNQLTTKEFAQKLYDSLSSQGVVVVNTISSIDGEHAGFLQSEFYTLKSVFPQVYIFPASYTDPSIIQNVVVYAFKSPAPISFSSNNPSDSALLAKVWVGAVPNNRIILTDDFSPVERFYKSFNF